MNSDPHTDLSREQRIDPKLVPNPEHPLDRRFDLRPVMMPVTDTVTHGPTYTTLFFEGRLAFSPGQFIMVWLPGLDEKPYTLSVHTTDRFGITIEAKGRFSRAAAALSPGDVLGIRGPFGNGFTVLNSPHQAVVAGGCGMAPLAPLVEQLTPAVCVIHGARRRDLILYPDRFDTNRRFATDDGSLGHKGTVIDLLNQEIQDRRTAGRPPLEMVYACGPEVMMHAVFTRCESHGIPCQVSLERYMRCGFGVCGACVCNDRVVCLDGPVFDSAALRTMTDFNRRALLKSGLPVTLPEYTSWRCKGKPI